MRHRAGGAGVSRKLIVKDGKSTRELALVGRIVVGRDPTCDLSAEDPLLSRHHVEFVAGPREVLARDLGSRNGILINGVKKDHAVLRSHDVVQVGRLLVRFVDDGAAFVPQDDIDAGAAPIRNPPSPLGSAPPPPQVAHARTVVLPANDSDALPVNRPADKRPMSPPDSVLDFDRTLPTHPSSKPSDFAETRFSAPPASAPDTTADQEKTQFVSPPTAVPLAKPSKKTPGTPAASPHALKADAQVFRDPGSRFHFEFPKSGWQIVPGGTVAVVSLLERAGEAAVVIERNRLDTPLAPADITELFAQVEADTLREQQPAAAEIEARLTILDKRRVVVTNYSRRGVNGPERVRQYSISTGSVLYRLTCSALTPHFERHEPVFAHVAVTFSTGANR
jgi:hypothetical protein